jgi:hypothetical protein
MSPTDPIVQFAALHLGGRSVPDDLRTLLELHWRDAATGKDNRLKSTGVTLLDADRMPDAVTAILAGGDDLEAAERLTRAQAMRDMIRSSGFVAEAAAGDAIGYWFGPDSIPIEAAPLLRFDPNGHFSILPGSSISEGILVVASRGDNQAFSNLRDYLNELGLNISAQSIQDIQPRECALHPQAVYQQLIRAYSSDLSTTSVPVTGDPVAIMTMYRGPKIGSEE